MTTVGRARLGLALSVACGLAGAGGCRRSGLPPRPDGAAVVITAGTPGGDEARGTPEIEPNDALSSAQRVALGPGAPAAVAGTLRATGSKRDVDLFRLDVVAPDGGAPAAPAPGPDGSVGVAAPARRLLRVDLRPDAGIAVTLDALDDAGKVLVSSSGDPGAPVSIPNLAVTPGTYYLRVRGSSEAAESGYRLTMLLAALETGAEIEPNGTAALATDLAPDGEAVGYLGWKHDQDWYRLPTAGLPEGSVLSLDLDAVPGVAASLQVFDAVERKLTEARGRKEERVAIRSLRVPTGDAQIYVVVRTDTGTSSETRYDLRTRTELPRAGGEAEPNDDAAHAQPVSDGTVLGYLSRGDVDVYRYTASAPTELDVEVAPPERVDIKLEILSETGARLARSDAGRRREAEHLPNVAVPGGTVLIRLSAGKSDGNPDEPYRLTVASRPPEAWAEHEPNDSPATATPLADGERGNGLLAPRGDVDFWRLAPATGAGELKVGVGGVSGLALAVRVLSASGRELGRATVSGEAHATIPVASPGEGGCLVEIREASGKAANPRDRYSLTVER